MLKMKEVTDNAKIYRTHARYICCQSEVQTSKKLPILSLKS